MDRCTALSASYGQKEYLMMFYFSSFGLLHPCYRIPSLNPFLIRWFQMRLHNFRSEKQNRAVWWKKKELNEYFPWPKYFSQTQRACCHTYFKYFTNVSEAGRTCWHTYFKAGCWTPFHCLPFDWTQLSKRCLSITTNQPRYHDWNTPAKFRQKSVSHFDRTLYNILHPIPSPPI